VINAEGKRNNQSRSIGKIDVPVSLIKSIPAMLGEADVMKTLQLLPGVQAGNEGSSGLHVRGGSVDQNLILLDGVPVYNASHAFGVFSVFNPDAVFNVEILKSGFPASYGGRLSSVIDVHLKEGDKYKVHGEGGIGIIFSKLTIEGPIKKEKSSFLISGRRTYADLLIRPILRISKSSSDVKPFFSDLNLKANFPAAEKDRFYLSLYLGKDNFHSLAKYVTSFSPDTVTFKSSYGFSWGNITAMARWNHEFTKQTFANFTFTHSRYDFSSVQLEEHRSNFQVNPLLSRQNYTSGIQDWNIRGDIDYLPAPNHFMKTGFTATLHRYQPGITRYFQRDTAVKVDKEIRNQTLYGGEYDVYAEDDIRLSLKSKLNLGLRLSAFEVRGKIFAALQPRINWLYKINERWQLKASAGKMNQFIHLLTNSNLGLPTDLWLPVTKRVPPQSSYQIASGITYRHDRSLEASMEVYYKSMNHVIDYTEGAGFGNAYDNWEDLVASGKGKSYGAEWLLQKKKGTLTGLLSYTLGRSERTFEHINGGRPFPYKYDKRHEVKLVAVWTPSKKLELGANWIFSSGSAISLPVGFYYDPITRRYVDIYNGRNNYRMHSYHRLDVSLKFMKQKKKHLRTWAISIYNVYSRFNPFFLYRLETSSGVIFKEVALLPFMPSFSYQFKF
jgi:outer membrane receptor for ferrienterochelin and colicin